MSIFTRFTSLAAILGIAAGLGLAAEPAAAKDKRWILTANQVDRNGDGRISDKERRWASSQGYEQTNDGYFEYVGNRGGRLLPVNAFDRNGDGKISKKERRYAASQGYEQTNAGTWERVRAGSNGWNNGWDNNGWNNNSWNNSGTPWWNRGGSDHDRH
jgi:hypothetical protein